MSTETLFDTTIRFLTKMSRLQYLLSKLSAPEGYPPLQQNILRIIYFSGPQTLSGLSGCTNTNLPNCSREVKKLTQAGCLVKEVSKEDKRIVRISLTPKGTKLIDEFLERAKEFISRHTGEWSPKQIEKCLKNMKALEKDFLDPIVST